MHKELLILGMIGDGGPMSGYDLHRVVRAHGELFRDLKKPNMYHLLGRLARDGYLQVRRQSGARGRRGEKLLYEISAAGRHYFHTLLAAELRDFTTVHTGIEVGIVFAAQIPKRSVRALLKARRDSVMTRRRFVAKSFGDLRRRGVMTRIAADHLLSLIDAERAWIDRSLRMLAAR